MNKPFTKYVCDVCGETIDSSKAMLQWAQQPTQASADNSYLEELKYIRICCKKKSCYSPLENKAIRENLHSQGLQLDDCLGSEKIDEVLTFPLGRIITTEMRKPFLEICRRLTLPYYEEARTFFSVANEDGFYHIGDYLKGYICWSPEALKEIIQKYSK